MPGPILHLYWVDALDWALPPQEIKVVDEVWEEVERHAARALQNVHLSRCTLGAPPESELSRWDLDAGEAAALTCALGYLRIGEVLVLCDELDARRACGALGIPCTGSVGLIVEAFRSGRVERSRALAALRDLPGRGRLHVRQEVIEIALNGL